MAGAELRVTDYSVVVIVPVAIVPVVVDVVDEYTDTSSAGRIVRGAANSSAYGRGVAVAAGAGGECRSRRILRYEDEVALGIGRHRVRAGRLRDGLDQDAGPVDHAEHCRLGRRGRARGRCFAIPVGAGVVAPIAL